MTRQKKISALAIGERGGGLSLWLAVNGVFVVSSDLHGVTSDAKVLHKKYNIGNLIKYDKVDVTDIKFKNNSFEIVIFKSVLGALRTKEKQIKAIKEIYRVLKKDGKLFFAENLVGSPVHMYFRKMFIKWSYYWRYIDIIELKEIFKCFKKTQYEAYGFFGAFGRKEWQRYLLSKIDKIINKFIPANYKYIVYGVCEKN